MSVLLNEMKLQLKTNQLTGGCFTEAFFLFEMCFQKTMLSWNPPCTQGCMCVCVCVFAVSVLNYIGSYRDSEWDEEYRDIDRKREKGI
jgi:hypothetical protein